MRITKKIAALTATLTTAMSLLAAPAMAFSVEATNNIETLKNNLLGPNTDGLSNFSISITGNAAAFGIFTNDPFGLTSGVVLSTGKVTDIPGPNLVSTSGNDLSRDFDPLGEAGDLAQLNLSFLLTPRLKSCSLNMYLVQRSFLSTAVVHLMTVLNCC